MFAVFVDWAQNAKKLYSQILIKHYPNIKNVDPVATIFLYILQ